MTSPAQLARESGDRMSFRSCTSKPARKNDKTSWHPLKAKRASHKRIKAKSRTFVNAHQTLKTRRREESDAAKGITRIVAWFGKQGFEVRFGKSFKDELYHDLKRVKICTKYSLQSQMIGLLHEAGHLLLNRNESEYQRRFGRGLNVKLSSSKAKRATLVHRVQVIEEEIDAWNRGERLAKRLGCKVNHSLWNQVRYVCLSNYAAYTAKKWNMTMPEKRLSSDAKLQQPSLTKDSLAVNLGVGDEVADRLEAGPTEPPLSEFMPSAGERASLAALAFGVKGHLILPAQSA